MSSSFPFPRVWRPPQATAPSQTGVFSPGEKVTGRRYFTGYSGNDDATPWSSPEPSVYGDRRYGGKPRRPGYNSVPFHLRPYTCLAPADAPGTSASNSFRLVSYNLLAQSLIDFDHFPTVPPQFLTWQHRSRNLIKELDHWDGEIVCLQEVDVEMWKTLQPHYTRRGYACRLLLRTGDKTDGCAMLWRNTAFELCSYEEVKFYGVGGMMSLMDRDNVAQITVLKPRHASDAKPFHGPVMHHSSSSSTTTATVSSPGKKHKPLMEAVPSIRSDGVSGDGTTHVNRAVIVVNVHLLFNVKRGDVKMCQLHHLMHRVADTVSRLQAESGDGTQPAVLICGDFNSTPGSALYSYMASGCEGIDLSGLRRTFISGQAGEDVRVFRPVYDGSGHNGSGSFLPQPRAYTYPQHFKCTSMVTAGTVKTTTEQTPTLPSTVVIAEDEDYVVGRTSTVCETVPNSAMKTESDVINAVPSSTTTTSLAVTLEAPTTTAVTTTTTTESETMVVLTGSTPVPVTSDDYLTLFRRLDAMSYAPEAFTRGFVLRHSVPGLRSAYACPASTNTAVTTTRTTGRVDVVDVDEDGGSSDDGGAVMSETAMPRVDNRGYKLSPTGEPAFTTYHCRMKTCVDYVWYNPVLRCVGIVEMLPPSELSMWKTLPTKFWSSDHMSLIADFQCTA